MVSAGAGMLPATAALVTRGIVAVENSPTNALTLWPPLTPPFAPKSKVKVAVVAPTGIATSWYNTQVITAPTGPVEVTLPRASCVPAVAGKPAVPVMVSVPRGRHTVVTAGSGCAHSRELG
jgi:hypothetical protein